MPQRRHQPESILPLVKGASGAGKERLAGDTARKATSDEVKDLRQETLGLKEVVAELLMENRLLTKSVLEDGGAIHEV